MTTWGVQGVARFCREAGFAGEELADAVALVLAATGGQDHYRHNVTSSPGSERRGLFALRVDEVPAEVADQLWTPKVAAAAALSLHAACGGRFSYHPAWIGGAAGRLRPGVVVALTTSPHRSGNVNVGSFRTRLGALVKMHDAIVGALPSGKVPGA